MLAIINDKDLFIACCMPATRFLDVGRGKGQDLVVQKISYEERETDI